MRAGQNADLAGDVPQVFEPAAIDALAVKNQIADHALLQRFQRRGHLAGSMFRASLRQELGLDAIFQPANRISAGVLAGSLFELAELRIKPLPEDILERIAPPLVESRLGFESGLVPQLFN